MSFNLRDGSWLYEWGGSRRTGDGDCTSLRPANRTVAGAAARDALLSCSPRFAQGRGEAVRRQMWSLDDFDIGRKLGEGRFGKIYLAREKRTKCAVVIKCLSKDMIRYHGLAHQLRREVELQEYAGRCHRHICASLHTFGTMCEYFWCWSTRMEGTCRHCWTPERSTACRRRRRGVFCGRCSQHSPSCMSGISFTAT
ncbi:hypothetical protein TcYC6_0021060 [Trypanosoma cruzi]|nr:hypothetical protein TcYC6_0021060 [Trypanosoma cruzi]